MSSETERITNEVLNRHPWDKLEKPSDKSCFEDAEGHQRTADERSATNRGSVSTDESALEFPQ